MNAISKKGNFSEPTSLELSRVDYVDQALRKSFTEQYPTIMDMKPALDCDDYLDEPFGSFQPLPVGAIGYLMVAKMISVMGSKE